MSVKFSRNLFLSLLSLALLHAALLAAGVWFILKLGLRPETLGAITVPPARWLPPGLTPDPRFLLQYNLAGICGVFVVGALIIVGLRNLYHKTDSPEILFLLLFGLSLCLESWRLGTLALPAGGASIRTAAFITRAVLAFRLFGLLCLLAGSLYAAGMQYRRYPLLIGGMGVLALSLALLLPLDATVFDQTLLYRLGDRHGYLFLQLILGLLMLVDFLAAARLRGSRRFAWVAVAAVLLLAGRELAVEGLAPAVMALGALCLAGGTMLFSREIGVHYLGL
jgi:hypothetical protein